MCRQPRLSNATILNCRRPLWRRNSNHTASGKPGAVHCTPIGNSWFHRLGVYLLHECGQHGLPPSRDLTELVSLVTGPSTSSVKSGKAARMFEGLVAAPTPTFLHEASADVLVGTQLALELLGDIDANRQEEHIRRIERAVGYAAARIMLDHQTPSIKQIQDASGMSWADANAMVERPYFNRLVFDYQCNHVLARSLADSCPACRRLADALGGRSARGRQMPRSV
jgi:hypothetical protein